MSEAHKAALLASRSSENKTVIYLNNKLRFYAVDERNWALQKMNGINSEGESIWVSNYYYNNLAELMKGTARRILNGELQAKGEVRMLELAEKIQEAEQSVLSMLQEMIPPEVIVAEEERKQAILADIDKDSDSVERKAS
jgi:hypothetical protein